MLDETQDRLCAGNTTDFSDLKAMIVNCTLKRGDEPSHTDTLLDQVHTIFEKVGVTVDRMRAIFMQYGQATTDEIRWGFAKFLETMTHPDQELAQLDDAEFRARFSGSPIKRIGRDRFVRNVLYAIGNSADPALRPVAQALTDDPDPTVAEAARWAAARL